MTGPATAMTSGAMTGQIEASRVRRQIGHDINHELATIRLLTLLLADAPELGPESRRRVALILGETRWLEQLYRAYESAVDPQTDPAREARAPISVDDVVAEVVDTMRQARMTRIGMATVPIDAHVDRLALWRVLRNIIDNATRAAGARGTVHVRMAADNGWATIQIDDDGPGFGGAGRGRMGLNIVQDFVLSVGGRFGIRRGYLGGCCVRLQFPLAEPPLAEVPRSGLSRVGPRLALPADRASTENARPA
jgi:signal transduction histidine kinase